VRSVTATLHSPHTSGGNNNVERDSPAVPQPQQQQRVRVHPLQPAGRVHPQPWRQQQQPGRTGCGHVLSPRSAGGTGCGTCVWEGGVGVDWWVQGRDGNTRQLEGLWRRPSKACVKEQGSTDRGATDLLTALTCFEKNSAKLAVWYIKAHTCT
jgi:hypothetical protein